MLLLCEPDWANIDLARTSLMMDLHNSFQSERRIAPYVILFVILFFYQA